MTCERNLEVGIV